MKKILLPVAHWDEFWGPFYACPFCKAEKLNDDFVYCPMCGKSLKGYRYAKVEEILEK